MNGEPMKRVDLRMFPMILASLILITRFRGSKNSFISSRVKPSMLGISTSISSSLTVMGCPIFDAENLSKKYRTHHVRRRRVLRQHLAQQHRLVVGEMQRRVDLQHLELEGRRDLQPTGLPIEIG